MLRATVGSRSCSSAIFFMVRGFVAIVSYQQHCWGLASGHQFISHAEQQRHFLDKLAKVEICLYNKNLFLFTSINVTYPAKQCDNAVPHMEHSVGR